MIKKIGLCVIGLLFFGTYIPLSLNIFFAPDQQIHYVKNELMFGSYTLLGAFIFMTIILLIVCNYFIDILLKKRNNKL